jgi:hypothetical protein
MYKELIERLRTLPVFDDTTIGNEAADAIEALTQPVQEQSCNTCKNCTVASQQSFEETCFVCSQYYDNKYEYRSKK